MKNLTQSLAQSIMNQNLGNQIDPLLSEDEAKQISGLKMKGEKHKKRGILTPHSIEEVHVIEQLAGKHLKLPKNVSSRMGYLEKLEELHSLLSPNQQYAYYQLPKASLNLQKK